MKKLILISLLLFCVKLEAADFTTNRNISIQWNSQPDATNFIVYFKTNLNQSTWTHLTNTTSLSNLFNVAQTQRYYVVTASNFWGESDFSEVVSTPNPPRNDNLSVRIVLK